MRRPTFVARHRLSLVLVFGHCLTLALYPKHPRLVVVEGKPLGERRALLPPLGVGRRGRGEEGEREEQRGPSSGRIIACPPAVRPTRDLSRFARMNVAITPRYSSSAAMRSAGASVVRLSNSRSASIGYARPISIRILPSAPRTSRANSAAREDARSRRSDGRQRASGDPGTGDQEEPIAAAQLRTVHRPLVDGELRSVSKSSRSPLRGICVHSGRLLSS